MNMKKWKKYGKIKNLDPIGRINKRKEYNAERRKKYEAKKRKLDVNDDSNSSSSAPPKKKPRNMSLKEMWGKHC